MPLLERDTLVLVTAASSYTGANIVLALLSEGYKVRAAVRTEAKADALRQQLQRAAGDRISALSFTLVGDGALHGACDEACRGVSGVIHVAAPLPFPCENIGEKILQKGVDMVLSVLASSTKARTVKRVVLTGSADSLFDWGKGLFHDHTYKGSEWTPSTWEEAEKGQTFLDILPAAKKYSEKAAWEYVQNNKEAIAYDLISILPTVTLGPYAGDIHSIKEIGGSAFFVVYKAQKSQTDDEMGPTIIPHAVDVRDVALAHVRALERGQGGKRYIISAECFDNDQILHTLADKGVLKRKVEAEKVHASSKGYFQLDNSVGVRDLHLTYRKLDETLMDTVRQFEQLKDE